MERRTVSTTACNTHSLTSLSHRNVCASPDDPQVIFQHSSFALHCVLFATILTSAAAASGGQENLYQPESVPQSHDQQGKRAELSRLSLEIERRLGNGTRFVTSVTPEESLKEYAKTYQRKVERVGNEALPQRKGESVYGRVRIMLTVNSKGRLEKTEVLEGEGADGFLVAHSRKILQRVVGDPFPADFPPGTRRVVFLADFNYRRE